MRYILPLILLWGCTPMVPRKVQRNPQKFNFTTDFELYWDNQYPITTYSRDITLNEPFHGINGFYYTLTKTNDTLYQMTVKVDENLYYPPYN